MTDKIEMFPVINPEPKFKGVKDYVPMDWVVKHAGYCLINHGQTPQRLKERGGLSHKELYAVIMDKKFNDVKESSEECRKIIMKMLESWIKGNSYDFNQHLVRLNNLAQNYTHDNFVEIQKCQSDILNDYTIGSLSEAEKCALYSVSIIIKNKMREKLKGMSNNGAKKNQDGSS